MAKFDIKQFMLEKGEKVVLGASVAGLGLLGLLGIMEATGGEVESPSTVASKLKNDADRIAKGLKNDDSKAPPLPAWTDGKFVSDPIDAVAFNAPYNYFEPVDTPSRLRENPNVLRIIDAQIDLVRAPMKAYDIRVSPEGTRTIGVLTKVKITPGDQNTVTQLMAQNGGIGRRNLNNRNRNQPPPPPPPPPAGGSSDGAAAGPGGGGSMPGRGGMGMGMGGMPGGPPGMGGGGGFDQSKERFESTVSYIPVDEFDKKPGTIPAVTVYPLRMVVVHAVFPLREQLEEIRRALRLQTVEDARRESAGGPGGPGTPAAGGPGPGPVRGGMSMGSDGVGAGAAATAVNSNSPAFAGFEIERKITSPTGQEFPWAEYKHEDVYLETIYSRKISDQVDDGYLSYFLRYDQRMAMPLPTLADGLGGYPAIRMDPIVRAVRRMEELRKTKPTPSDQLKKFKGLAGDNPFAPVSAAGAAGPGADGGIGGFMGSSSSGPGAGPGTGMRGPGGMPGPGGRNMPPPGGLMRPGDGPGTGRPPAAADSPEQDFLLLRFFDTDVAPRYTYQYRLRVVMKNPNFRRVKDVGRPDDANVDLLYGPWTAINTSVSVPSELNIYADDPVQYGKDVREKYKDRALVNLLDNNNGKLPVVQVQSWVPQINIESKQEPVGTWVIGDLPVNRGEFIGRKQIVSLPMWSSEKAAYLLQELPRYKVFQAKEQPKGLLVDFTTKYLLVDFDGGKARAEVANRGIDDESAVDMLILNPDGTVVVRNSIADAADKDREARAKGWADWLSKVVELTNRVGTPGSGPGDPGFDRNRPGGGG